MTPALVLALSLLLTDTPPPADQGGEPLPPGAPTDSYQLAAWCYGALDEYLTIYQTVKPDLKDMDRMFGTPVVEDEPYHQDMAAAHTELTLIGNSVTEAEKASPRPIAEQGVAAIKQGRAIWSIAEAKTRRELARAWMLWALPDRCDSNAKQLTQRSVLFGKALNYNNATPAPAPVAAPAPADAAPAGGPAALESGPPPAQPPAATDPSAAPASDTSTPATPQTAPPSDTAPALPARDPGIPPYPLAPGADQPKAAAPQP